MSSQVAQYTAAVAAGNDLTADEARTCADAVFAGAATELEQVVALLQALAEKGEAAGEVTGFARAILERATPAPVGVRGLGVDLAGTGGSGLARFNVSTAAAFTVAAAGTPVVKHGNRGSRQPNGSFDFLDALGVDYGMSPQAMERCFADTGLAFFFARAWHPAMAAVAPARQQVARRTIFNLAAPLCNPAQPPYQFMGASSVAAAELLIEVLADLGRRRALVVCGAPGIDDLSIAGPTEVFALDAGTVRRETVSPEQFGIAPVPYDALPAGSGEHNAALFTDLIAAGAEPSSLTELICLNAGAALYCAEAADSIAAGYAAARSAFADGGVTRKVAQYREQD
ncbi:MAG: anthranilate phosphoribosyltransferase [Gammaproteobacteria bacterium]|nr:anthranilate phosphoribosyltransferase [Gammaproteobacteria bacterium]